MLLIAHFMINTPSTSDNVKKDSVKEFIDQLLHVLSTDKMMHETNTMGNELTKFYNEFASGNIDTILKSNMQAAIEMFEKQLLLEYIQGILHSNIKPGSLAFHSAGNTILVWAEVNNEEEENELYRLEGRMNSKFGDKGIKLDTTVVEAEDQLPIPAHYRQIRFTA
jgi:hypothetical protein